MDKRLEMALQRVQKPARYVGGEPNSVIKDKNAVDLRFLFCFPDTYEVGMSHLGMRILYSLLNERPNIWCERCFAPWFDMEKQMKRFELPLFALESGDPACEFDVIGFTLQYELSYTNVLYMLELGGVALRAKDRGEESPIVIAGGPCACNPEPLADFFDLFVLGEGEEVTLEVCDEIIRAKKDRLPRHETLKRLAQIKGVYVPSLYEVTYATDGTVEKYTAKDGAPKRVQKRIIEDFTNCFFPDKFVVPLIEIVHDRAVTEVLRGCIRGCRFCQAGFIYRPFRARSFKKISEQAKNLCENCGYDEVSLTSLSTSDHPQIEPMLDDLLTWSVDKKINLSLPSLRIDTFSDELIEKTTMIKKSGLTFAPEAGTQRLRDVINKNITEKDIFDSCSLAFKGGYTTVKLYFMMGHPTETDEDILGIAKLARDIVELYYHTPERPKGRYLKVNVSVACFVPKPHTPFQFCAQDTMAEFERKQRLLTSAVHSKNISLSWHDASTALVEAVLAKGDRRLSFAIESAYRSGSYFDSWGEGFSLDRWLAAFEQNGIDPSFYANRALSFDEVFAWDIFDYGVDKKYLQAEYERALFEKTTPPCHKGCRACGMSGLAGRACFDYD